MVWSYGKPVGSVFRLQRYCALSQLKVRIWSNQHLNLSRGRFLDIFLMYLIHFPGLLDVFLPKSPTRFFLSRT